MAIDLSLQDKILEEDFESVESDGLRLKDFYGSSFLITGSTGLIGSLMVKTLLYYNRKYDLKIKIYAVVRNIEKAKSVFSQESDNTALSFVVTEDLGSGNFEFSDKVDFIIHTAAITNSKEMVTFPVSVLVSAFNSTDSLLKIARDNNASMVYLSSMEVYGNIEKNEMTDEKSLGYIDLSSVRSCYPESKRACECLCNAYSAQYGVNVTTARLAQTFGAGILPTENRVFAQFARSVIDGNDIVLHTNGLSEGNYVYTSDAIRAILILLKKGKSKEAYNICNPASHTTIIEMARMVAHNIAEDKIKVVIDIPSDSMKYGYAPNTKLFLDNTKLCSLGWKPQVGLEQAYRKLISWIKVQ